MVEGRWARLKGDVNCGLRRGAWYRVLQLTPHEAVLDVQHKQVSLARATLQFVSTPPRAWTVVARPPDARGLPTMWGDMYAVCPGCRNRAPLKGSPQSLRCPRCSGVYKLAWEEWFVGPA